MKIDIIFTSLSQSFTKLEKIFITMNHYYRNYITTLPDENSNKLNLDIAQKDQNNIKPA